MDYRLQKLGWNIRSLRESRGYTIEYMAEMVDVSPAHIQRIETANKGVSLSCLCRIADVLQVSLGLLVEMDSTAGSACFYDELQEQMSLQEVRFNKHVFSVFNFMKRVYAGILISKEQNPIDNLSCL